jgi:hypothetical protein
MNGLVDSKTMEVITKTGSTRVAEWLLLLGIAMFTGMGCLVTDSIQQAPAPAVSYQAPYIDMTSVEPADNIVYLTVANECPTMLTFSVGRVIDPDAVSLPKCGGQPARLLQYAARLFVTALPQPPGTPPPIAERPIKTQVPMDSASPDGTTDCDVVAQAEPFTVDPSTLNCGQANLVEIVVSNFFSLCEPPFREPQPGGYGTDTVSWLVVNSACNCATP